MPRLVLLFLILIISVKAISQEDERKEVPQAFAYNSILKLSKEEELSPGFLSKVHLNLSYGFRFHRYDPVYVSTQEGTSSYSDSSNVYLTTFEYRPVNAVSVFYEGSYEEQIVQRYDGIDLSSSQSTASDNLVGIQININPVFLGVNYGQRNFPIYFDRQGTGFGFEQLNATTIGTRIGLRRTLNRSFFLNFFFDYRDYGQMGSVVSELEGQSFGASIWLQHSSGIGINFREERGELRSDEIVIGMREFSAMVFVGL